MTTERHKYDPVRLQFPRREEMQQRIKAVGQTIHSPGAWYRDDVKFLIVLLDSLNTKLHEAQKELDDLYERDFNRPI